MLRYVFFLVIIFGTIASCGKSDNIKEEDILVSINDVILTRSEVEAEIPIGVAGNDSIRIFNSIVEEWITNQLLNDVAIKNIPDIEKIDKLVEEYRKTLISYEYRKQMILGEDSIYSIPSDSIKAYYDRNKENFRLEEPIIKGIYVKIGENAPRLNELRKWYKSNKQSDIEKIEKYGLNGIINYEYFKDRWISWSDIEKNIPYIFENPNNFVKTNKTLDITKNGFVYLLNISDYLVQGSTMPFEYAEPKIKDMLINANQRKFDRLLRKKLYDNAIESGSLKIYYKDK